MAVTVAIIAEDPARAEVLQRSLARDPACICVGFIRDGKLAGRQLFRLAPEVAIMDALSSSGPDIEGIAKLRRLLPRTQILVIARHAELAPEALRAGASGYLLGSPSPEKLLEAVHEIHRGGVPLSGQAARRVLQLLQRGLARFEGSENLTTRERQILDLLAEGGPSREIAQQLCISVDTVNTHLKHIYGKLEVRSRTEAVIKYLNRHLSGTTARPDPVAHVFSPRAAELAGAAD